LPFDFILQKPKGFCKFIFSFNFSAQSFALASTSSLVGSFSGLSRLQADFAAPQPG